MTIIGRSEWIALTDLGVPAIKVRVDSGAKTSSLHAFNIKPLNREGKTWIKFDIHPIQKNRKVVIHAEAEVIDQRKIKSSNGESEKRYVICVPMSLAGKTYDIEITLSNRDNMGFRMLLGREAMNRRMLIDPSIDLSHGDYERNQITQMY